MRWNYDLNQLPEGSERVLGLFHQGGIRIIWRAEQPHGTLQYLCDALCEQPYYINDPLAFCLIPSTAPSGFPIWLSTKAKISPHPSDSPSVRLKQKLLTMNPLILQGVKSQADLARIAYPLGFKHPEVRIVWESYRQTSIRKRQL